MVAQVLRMKEAVHAWSAAQPKTFFFEGIKKFVQGWKKCIEKHGDYVKKWCYYKLYIFIEIKFVSVVRIIIDPPTYITALFSHKNLRFYICDLLPPDAEMNILIGHAETGSQIPLAKHTDRFPKNSTIYLSLQKDSPLEPNIDGE